VVVVVVLLLLQTRRRRTAKKKQNEDNETEVNGAKREQKKTEAEEQEAPNARHNRNHALPTRSQKVQIRQGFPPNTRLKLLAGRWIRYYYGLAQILRQHRAV
jgi:hypothetical protein